MDVATLPTEMKMLATPLGKPTAGDIVLLTVTPPPGMADARPANTDLKPGRLLSVENAGDKLTLHLTTYTPGVFKIPSIVFEKDGQAVFQTEPKEVEYASVGKKKEAVAIYDPVGVPMPRWVFFGGAFLFLAALLGVLALVARAVRKRRSLAAALAAAPRTLTPLEEFSEKLRATLSQKYLEAGKQKPHYFALSDAAKRFLGKELRIDAEERTTRELARELEKAILDKNLIRNWIEIFQEMDVVKFTDQQAPAAQASALSGRLEELARKSCQKPALEALPEARR